MHLVFWQNIVSPHQSYFLNEIGKEFDVVLIVEEYLSKERISQGWTNPTIDNIEIIKINNNTHLSTLIDQSKSKINIFSGFTSRKFPKMKIAFQEMSKFTKLYILAECPILTKQNKILKHIKYRLLYSLYGKKIAHVFAIGTLGRDFYISIGFDPGFVSTFQYFVEKQPIYLINDSNKVDLSFIFVGQLIHRKGVDMLIKAFSKIPKEKEWSLTIVGSGEIENYLKFMVTNFQLNDKIFFRGNLNNADVRILISSSDYLVLPSRFDGWGAVVSEALSVGTKVICSDMCGASVLINDFNGYVYPHNSVHQLKEKIEKAFSNDLNFNRSEVINHFNAVNTLKINEFIEKIKYGK